MPDDHDTWPVIYRTLNRDGVVVEERTAVVQKRHGAQHRWRVPLSIQVGECFIVHAFNGTNGERIVNIMRAADA